MNKRQRKKLINKHGYKNWNKRLKNCKSISQYLCLIYPNHLLNKLIWQKNPLLSLIKKEDNNFYKPVILGIEHGVNFNE